jgi:hypothetical protein
VLVLLFTDPLVLELNVLKAGGALAPYSILAVALEFLWILN